MVIKASTLKHRKILTQKGKQLETIDDILYDPDQKGIIAFIARKGGIFTEAKILLKNFIQQIGRNAILVVSDTAVQKVSQLDNHIQDLVKNPKLNLVKNKLVGEDATEYGTSTDVFFDSQTGKVLGFEYTKSGTTQKKTMKLEELLSVGPDAIVVRPVLVNSAGQVKQQNERIHPKPDQAFQPQHRSQRAQQMENATPLPAKENKQNIRVQQASSNDISPEKLQQIKDTIGKYATKNILLPTDELLIRQNDILTHESLRIAYTYGVLDQVLQNASRTPVM